MILLGPLNSVGPGSLSPSRRPYLKPRMALRYAGPPRGGQEGTMTPGYMDYRGPWASGRPMASAGPAEGPWAREGLIEMTVRNQHVRPFFFWWSLIFDGKNRENFGEDVFFLEITSQFGQNCGIFSVCFGVHKTGNPSYLSWPRAHVRLSAPLTVRYTSIFAKKYATPFL